MDGDFPTTLWYASPWVVFSCRRQRRSSSLRHSNLGGGNSFRPRPAASAGTAAGNRLATPRVLGTSRVSGPWHHSHVRENRNQEIAAPLLDKAEECGSGVMLTSLSGGIGVQEPCALWPESPRQRRPRQQPRETCKARPSSTS